MGQIKIESAGVLQIRSRVSAQSHTMSSVSSIISGVYRDLDMQIGASAGINQALISLQRKSTSQKELLDDMTQMLQQAADRFSDTDRKLGKEAGGLQYLANVTTAGLAAGAATVVALKGIDTATKTDKLNTAFGLGPSATLKDAAIGIQTAAPKAKPVKKNFWDKVSDKWDGFTDTVSDGWNNFKTGVADVVDSTKETVAGWVDSYKEKGTVFKVVETGKAVGSIVISGFAIAGAWTASALTAGAGVPGAVLTTGYLGNDILGELSDIKNCWWGDVEKVNNTNLLKNALEDGAGDIAEHMGLERESGEKFGSAIYTGGKLVLTVTKIDDLIGKTVQAPDLLETVKKGAKELKTGISGTLDIAVHSDIRNIGKDFALLKYQIPNLVETAKTGGIIRDLGETAIDIGKKGFSVVGDTIQGIAAAWK